MLGHADIRLAFGLLDVSEAICSILSATGLIKQNAKYGFKYAV